MNAQEFKEMQTEFAEFIYFYESFLKTGQILDLKYNNAFGDILDQINTYTEELNCMQSELKTLAEKNDLEEVKKVHEDFVKLHVENANKIKSKHLYAESFVKFLASVTEEDKAALEEAFKDYVLNYHPAVKLFVSEGEVQLYNHLKRAYYESNYKAFVDLLNMNKDKIQHKEITEEDKIKFSQNYYDSKIALNRDIQERQKKYPFLKGDIFSDDISVAQEEGEIKSNLSKLREAHKKLAADYKNAFGVDFSL